jgi:hypothetical protein
VPTYLRWIAAMTAGVTAYFAFSVLSLGIAVATGHKEIKGGAAALLALAAGFVTLLAALAVNDWLVKRYPKQLQEADLGRGLRPPHSAG